MYCVYEHWYKGKCFYVGSGSLVRAFKFGYKNKTNSRSEEWWKFCEDNTDEVVVKIIHNNIESKKESVLLEEIHTINMLRENHPITNFQIGNMKSQISNFKRSNKLTGRKESLETRSKKSKSLKGRIMKEETKVKMSKNHANVSGGNNPAATAVVLFINDKKIYESETLKGMFEYCSENNICGSKAVGDALKKNIYSKKLKKFNVKIKYL